MSRMRIRERDSFTVIWKDIITLTHNTRVCSRCVFVWPDTWWHYTSVCVVFNVVLFLKYRSIKILPMTRITTVQWSTVSQSPSNKCCLHLSHGICLKLTLFRILRWANSKGSFTLWQARKLNPIRHHDIPLLCQVKSYYIKGSARYIAPLQFSIIEYLHTPRHVKTWPENVN